MKNKWLGYLASVLIVFAGVFFIIAGKTVAGIFLILVSIVSSILKFKMMKQHNDETQD